MPPARVEPAAAAPPVYSTLAAMPESRVITEFPFGDPAWELRYVYYSTVHWKRLVNGYSGAFPRGYHVRAARLQRLADNPDEAWQVLRDTGTTHVIVHHDAFQPGGAQAIERWLPQRRGAAFDKTLRSFDDCGHHSGELGQPTFDRQGYTLADASRSLANSCPTSSIHSSSRASIVIFESSTASRHRTPVRSKIRRQSVVEQLSRPHDASTPA